MNHFKHHFLMSAEALSFRMAFVHYVQSQWKESESQGVEIQEQNFKNGLSSSNSSEWVRVSKRREVKGNKRVERNTGEGTKVSSGGEMPQPLVGSLGKGSVREKNKINHRQSVRENKISMGRKKGSGYVCPTNGPSGASTNLNNWYSETISIPLFPSVSAPPSFKEGLGARVNNEKLKSGCG
ncbi:hypothetical protein U1Q18_025815 [Sarracenia purpurea var. burkii]